MSFKQLLNKKVKEQLKGLLSTDEVVLRCEACEKEITYSVTHGAHTLSSHLKTEKHKTNEAKGNWKKSSQTYLKATLTSQQTNIKKRDEFNGDLCEWLVATNIPLYKVTTRQRSSLANICQLYHYQLRTHYD